MPSLTPQDRKFLCRFTFADGRQCLPVTRTAPHAAVNATPIRSPNPFRINTYRNARKC